MAWIMIISTIVTMVAILGIRYYFLARKQVSLKAYMFEKETHDKNTWRIVSIVMCIICIAIYIGFRWSLSIYNISHYDLFNAGVSEFRSANLSIFLMLDLCSLLGVLLPITIIFDWKHQYILKPVALLALLGGTATVFFTTPDLYGHRWDVQLYFIGSRTIGVSDSDEPLMFLMHYWMIVMSLIVIALGPKITLKEYLKTITFILCYAGYITLCSQLLDIKTHVTATVIGDFIKLDPQYYSIFAVDNGHPSYQIFLEIYGINDWISGAVVTWITFAVIVSIFVLIKNTVYYFEVKNNLIDDPNVKYPLFDFIKNKAEQLDLRK